MEVTIKRSALAAELGRFQSIVERKSTIPILSNVLVEASAGEVKFSATDLDVTLATRASGEASGVVTGRPGMVTLPARKLHEVVKALPEGDVRIAALDGKQQARVQSGNYDAHIPTLPREAPTLPAPPGVAFVALPAKALREFITRVQFAITGEDTRYYLNGALLELTNTSMTMVATDGHRMCKADVAVALPPTSFKEPLKTIIPDKSLAELARMLDEADAEAQVTFERGEQHLFFTFGSTVLSTRMIDGTFPAYEKVIPKGNDKHIAVEQIKFAQALRRVAIMTAEKTRSIKLNFIPGKCEITAASAEAGDAREEVAVDYAGPDIAVTVNASYLMDFANVITAADLSIELRDDVSQVLCRPLDGEPVNYIYVVMPMRT